MAYATPRTWVAGDVLTAAQLNQDVRDNVGFLANPPACRAYRSTDQSISDNSTVTVVFNAENYDNANMWEGVTNPSRITVPVAGLYFVTFTAYYNPAADYTETYADLYKNGVLLNTGQSGAATTDAAARRVQNTGVFKLAANDYIEVKVYQNNASNAARNLVADATCLTPAITATWTGLG